MRNLHEIDHYRDRSPEIISYYGSSGDGGTGVFNLPSPRTQVTLRVIASDGMDWDHVSVSLPNRCPNWTEMEHVKRTFFQEHETAMQLHVPPSDHINRHPYCLHLWRPQKAEIPRPPAGMVG